MKIFRRTKGRSLWQPKGKGGKKKIVKVKEFKLFQTNILHKNIS